LLLLDNVSKSYSKNGTTIQALDRTKLSVDKGEFVAVKGASGSGKTTLLLIAGGLLHPDEGTVFINGENLYEKNADERSLFRSQNIGFVFQQYHLVPYLTVFENILAPSIANPGRNIRDRARFLLEHFGMGHRKDHTPGELSAGEKQRTALARALLFEPKLLLADEITGNLDARNAHIVMEYLNEFSSGGGSVLLVTHDTEAAKNANRWIELGGVNVA
jgi:putative ABC transport system ATP-binding protein